MEQAGCWQHSLRLAYLVHVGDQEVGQVRMFCSHNAEGGTVGKAAGGVLRDLQQAVAGG